MKQYYFNISMHDLQLSYTLCSVLFSTVQRNSSIELSRTSALGFPHLETQKEKRACSCPLRQKTLSPSKKYFFLDIDAACTFLEHCIITIVSSPPYPL